MHELSISSAILSTVLSQLPADYTKVTRIDITLGDLSGFVPEHVNYYFQLLSRNTPAQGAILNFKYERSKFRCTVCGKIYERCNFSMRCPLCNSRGRLLEGCTSLYINSIEVEQ